MPNELRIRQMIQEEITKNQNKERFSGVNSVVNHDHDGKNTPKIKAENIIPSVSTAGSIVFGTEGATYTINLNTNFTPSNILAYGVVTDAAVSPSIRCHTVGSAQLTTGFYLQPETNRSVVMGGPQYPFPTEQLNGSKKTVPIQGSSFIYVNESSGAVRSGVSENHIVSIFIGDEIADIRARVTVVDFSRSFIKLYVPYLTSGWRVNVNYVIT
jgi:hypothetical protein